MPQRADRRAIGWGERAQITLEVDSDTHTHTHTQTIRRFATRDDREHKLQVGPNVERAIKRTANDEMCSVLSGSAF